VLKSIHRAVAFLLIILSISACSSIEREVQGEIEITFSNQSPLNLCEVYITEISANSWGANLLIKPDSIPAGGERAFTLAADTYDLLARTCAKEVVYSTSDVAGDFTAVIGGAGLLPVRAVNRTDLEICYVFAAPAGAGAWGEDLLGSVETILPANVRWFFLESGPVNLRAEDCDHNLIAIRENFDPSAGLNWEIAP
jgi:hypothetical protein